MAKPRRIAWDACTWIATIIQEKALLPNGAVEDRAALCNHTIELATKGSVEIATSGLSLAEVCKDLQVKGTDGDVLADFFRNEFILVVPVDRAVGTLARQLIQAGHAKLRPPDAVHLATAIIADASEFHTFDGGLLKLDGKLAKPTGGFLAIKKPPAPPPTLFG
jgi:predicted nucleic acid-binding protein